MRDRIDPYFDTLSRLIRRAECTDGAGQPVELAVAFERTRDYARATVASGNKIMFVGNGGSAGIASHLAADFSKAGRMPAMAFNDGAALTCLSNDLGYENVFSEQIKWHGRDGDVVIAISSSGKSPNIIRAAETAKAKGCSLVTFSGFGADNPLRPMGDVNLFVNSHAYGFVEVAHMALCHAILDLELGWSVKS